MKIEAEIMTPRPSTFHERPAKASRVGVTLKFILVSNKPGPRVLLPIASLIPRFLQLEREEQAEEKLCGCCSGQSFPPPALPGSEGPSSSQLGKCRYRKFQTKTLLILLERKHWLLNATCSNRKYSSQPLKSFTQNTASFFLRVFFLPRNKKHPLSIFF